MAGTVTVDQLIFEIKVKSELEGTLDAITKKIDKTESAFIKAFKAISTTLVNIGKAIPGKLYTELINAGKAAQSFQDTMVRAHQAINLSGIEASLFDREIRKLALNIGGIPLKTLGELAGTAGILGLKGTENIKTFIEAIAKLDVATDVTAQKAAEKIPAILTVYQTSTADMGVATQRFADLLTHLGFNINATQSQILDVATMLSGASATSKLTIEEMLAVSAVVASVEKRFHTGGSAIQQILQRMASQSTKWANVLKLNFEEFTTAIETEPIEALKMVFEALLKIGQGTNGVQAANQTLKQLSLSGVRVGGVLLKMAQAFQELDRTMLLTKEASGSLQSAFDIAMEQFSKQWQRVLNFGNETRLLFGEDLLEMITKIIELDFAPFFENFIKMLSHSKLLTSYWPRLLNAFRETVRGMVRHFEWFLYILDQTGPWDAIKYIMENFWEWVKEKTGSIFTWIGQGWDWVKEKAWEALGPEGQQTVQEWIEVIGKIPAALETVIRWINDLKGAWENFMRIVREPTTSGGQTQGTLRERLLADARRSGGIQWDDVFRQLGGGRIVTEEARGQPQVIQDAVNQMNDLAEATQGYYLADKRVLENVATMREQLKNWKETGLSIQQATKKAIEFAGSMGFTINQIQALAREAYGQSTFPQISYWIQRNITDLDALRQKLQETTAQIRLLSPGSELWTRTGVGPALRGFSTERRSDLSFSANALMSAIRSTERTQQQEGSVVINVSGTVLDEQALRTFANKIGDILYEEQHAIVSVGEAF